MRVGDFPSYTAWGDSPAPERALLLSACTAAFFGAALRWAPSGSVFLVTAGAALCSLAFAAFSGVFDKRVVDGFVPSSAITWLKDVALGVGFGLLLTAATVAAFNVLKGLFPSIEGEAQGLYRLVYSDVSLIIQVPVLIFVILVEEIIWRGLVFRSFRESSTPPLLAVALVTLLYVVPQILAGAWLLMVVALGCGAFWTTQRNLGANLLMIFVTHLVWDLCIFYFFPLVEITSGGPTALP